jgi:hypothetical protein
LGQLDPGILTLRMTLISECLPRRRRRRNRRRVKQRLRAELVLLLLLLLRLLLLLGMSPSPSRVVFCCAVALCIRTDSRSPRVSQIPPMEKKKKKRRRVVTPTAKTVRREKQRRQQQRHHHHHSTTRRQGWCVHAALVAKVLPLHHPGSPALRPPHALGHRALRVQVLKINKRVQANANP